MESAIWWKYLIVYLWATAKFVVAPITGYATGLNWLENTILTIAGMMTTFTIIGFVGEKIKNYVKAQQQQSGKRKKVFSKKNRFIVRIWRKFGIYGICFLTPIIFSPIVGSILAVTLERDRKKSWLVMLFFATFWALALSLALKFGGDSVLKLLK